MKQVFLVFDCIKKLIGYFFPLHCISCDKIGDLICLSCLTQVQAHAEICPSCHRHSYCGKICINCKSHYPDLEGIMIVFNYSKLIKKLILSLKYYHKYTIAGFFAEKLSLLCLCNYLLPPNSQTNNILITNVPSHRYRHYFVKGYNQSQLLARHVAKSLGAEYKQLISKRKNTRSQASLDRKQRLINLSGSFEISSTIPKYIQTIIIIDDITTTGKTLQEMASCIKQSFPHVQVRGAVVARSNK